MLPSPVLAGTITYSFTGTASGTLDGTSFSAALMTITALADSSTPGTPFSSTIVVGALSDTFNLEGAILFFNPTCSSNLPCVGFELTPGDVEDISNSGFTGYSLGTPIGPLTDPSPITNLTKAFLDDSGGTLVLTSLNNGSVTVSSTAVPEPATMALVGSSLALVGLLRKRASRTR
jgi:hypothetical protein